MPDHPTPTSMLSGAPIADPEDEITIETFNVIAETFSPSVQAILHTTQSEVRALVHRKGRARVVKDAETAILRLPENSELGREGRLKLSTRVKEWLRLNAHVKIKVKAHTKHWRGRDVLYAQQPKLVAEVQDRLYQIAVRKDKEPKKAFSYFQKAITYAWDKQSPEDQKSYEATAADWNTKGLPVALRAREAEKHAGKRLAAFAQDMWLTMGMRLLFFASFRRESGVIACTQMDYNDTLGSGRSYITANPSFKDAGITSRDWVDHNTTYYDPSKQDTGGRASRFQVKRDMMDLPLNKYGEPILPDPAITPHGMKPRQYRIDVLRAFLSIHYGLASDSQPKIPWAKFLPKARECIPVHHMSDQILEGLKEPSSLNSEQLLRILSSLYYKQEHTDTTTEPAFRFTHWVTKSGSIEEANDRKLAPVVFGCPDEDNDDVENHHPNYVRPRLPSKGKGKAKDAGPREKSRARGKHTNHIFPSNTFSDDLPNDDSVSSDDEDTDGDGSEHGLDKETFQELDDLNLGWGSALTGHVAPLQPLEATEYAVPGSPLGSHYHNRGPALFLEGASNVMPENAYPTRSSWEETRTGLEHWFDYSGDVSNLTGFNPDDEHAHNSNDMGAISEGYLANEEITVPAIFQAGYSDINFNFSNNPDVPGIQSKITEQVDALTANPHPEWVNDAFRVLRRPTIQPPAAFPVNHAITKGVLNKKDANLKNHIDDILNGISSLPLPVVPVSGARQACLPFESRVQALGSEQLGRSVPGPSELFRDQTDGSGETTKTLASVPEHNKEEYIHPKHRRKGPIPDISQLRTPQNPECTMTVGDMFPGGLDNSTSIEAPLCLPDRKGKRKLQPSGTVDSEVGAPKKKAKFIDRPVEVMEGPRKRTKSLKCLQGE